MELLNKGALYPVKRVMEKAQKVLPKWLVISSFSSKTKRGSKVFNLTTDYDEKTILLGVLSACDGNRSHAVAVHGGFIYDANEDVAIPYGKKGLDYCTSTPEKNSTFKEFCSGLLIKYEGGKSVRIRKMTLQMEA